MKFNGFLKQNQSCLHYLARHSVYDKMPTLKYSNLFNSLAQKAYTYRNNSDFERKHIARGGH